MMTAVGNDRTDWLEGVGGQDTESKKPGGLGSFLDPQPWWRHKRHSGLLVAGKEDLRFSKGLTRRPTPGSQADGPSTQC